MKKRWIYVVATLTEDTDAGRDQTPLVAFWSTEVFAEDEDGAYDAGYYAMKRERPRLIGTLNNDYVVEVRP